MGNLPKSLKLTKHARLRIDERKKPEQNYYTKNLLKSSCKWYMKDDLVKDSQLYKHCLYVCRKSNRIGYLTDGELEILYNKNSNLVITVLQFKEKFKPIRQFIKPEILEKNRNKNQKLILNENKKDIIENSKDNIDNINEEYLIFYELCAFIKEQSTNKLFKKTNYETEIKTFQSHNIVYRERCRKAPMTINELFKVNKYVK